MTNGEGEENLPPPHKTEEEVTTFIILDEDLLSANGPQSPRDDIEPLRRGLCSCSQSL